MSGNRKMLRDQVRNHLKKAKKSVPPEYRNSITFSSVFNILKSSSKSNKLRELSSESVALDVEQNLLPQTEQVEKDEDQDSEPKANF